MLWQDQQLSLDNGRPMGVDVRGLSAKRIDGVRPIGHQPARDDELPPSVDAW